MAAQFVLRKTRSGRYFFNLRASNGEIVATSEQYTTKGAALAGIESVRHNAEAAPVEDHEDAIAQAQATITRALSEPSTDTVALQAVRDTLTSIEKELVDQRASWIGVKADLDAPAVHYHDETAVPMSITAGPVETHFVDDEAEIGWRITYRCPQCQRSFEMAARLSLEVEIKPRAARVAEIGWFPGTGPGNEIG